jgi:acetyl esterase/lipase
VPTARISLFDSDENGVAQERSFVIVVGMNLLLALLPSLGAVSALLAAEPRQNPQVIPLWAGTPPNAQPAGAPEEWAKDGPSFWLRHVRNPAIEVRLPAPGNATGQAVVVCPGGGYGGLAYDWEGTDIAAWLNSHGIAAVILRYRLPADGDAADAVSIQNSILFYQALLAHNVRAELHVYPYGGHGFSLAIGKGRLQDWTQPCARWLAEL